jgi:hypothetical protein
VSKSETMSSRFVSQKFFFFQTCSKQNGSIYRAKFKNPQPGIFADLLSIACLIKFSSPAVLLVIHMDLWFCWLHMLHRILSRCIYHHRRILLLRLLLLPLELLIKPSLLSHSPARIRCRPTAETKRQANNDQQE